jgi:hypothetical protein
VLLVKNLYEAASVDGVKQRIARLRPDSPRQWGKMNPAQMLAHCSVAMQMAVGEVNPPRMFVGRILGPLVKPMALAEGAPMRRNTPTSKDLLVRNDRDFETERQRLSTLIDRFAAAGPAGCSTHPHTFFGALTPQEWSTLMYKHLDHHLRQFNV